MCMRVCVLAIKKKVEEISRVIDNANNYVT